MKYEIVGDNFPAVKCYLTQGETMKCEGGSMAWMDDGIEMKTEGGGGLGKALGRMVSGESVFFNNFTCKKAEGEIAFSSSYPPFRLMPYDSTFLEKCKYGKQRNSILIYYASML